MLTHSEKLKCPEQAERRLSTCLNGSREQWPSGAIGFFRTADGSPPTEWMANQTENRLPRIRPVARMTLRAGVILISPPLQIALPGGQPTPNVPAGQSSCRSCQSIDHARKLQPKIKTCASGVEIRGRCELENQRQGGMDLRSSKPNGLLAPHKLEPHEIRANPHAFSVQS